MIAKAQRETRFRRARGADRLDGGRGRHPLSVRRGLALHGARALAREGRKLAALVGGRRARVRDRSRASGRTAAAISPDARAAHRARPRRRCCALTGEAGELVARSVARGAPAGRAGARERARGRGAQAKLRAAARLDELADALPRRSPSRSTSALRGREDHRPAGLDRRPRRAADPQGQARQADRVRLRRPARRGHREHPPRRARPDPARRHRARLARPRTRCCPTTAAELDRLGLRPREVALDGGFQPGRRPSTLARPATERVHRRPPSSPAPDAPANAWPRYRTGIEGRISHLKRGYGLRRIRLKGHDGAADLDRLGDPRLQPRHARHPNRLTPSRASRTTRPGTTDSTERPRHHPSAAVSVQPGRLSGGSS